MPASHLNFPDVFKVPVVGFRCYWTHIEVSYVNYVKAGTTLWLTSCYQKIMQVPWDSQTLCLYTNCQNVDVKALKQDFKGIGYLVQARLYTFPTPHWLRMPCTLRKLRSSVWLRISTSLSCDCYYTLSAEHNRVHDLMVFGGLNRETLTCCPFINVNCTTDESFGITTSIQYTGPPL